MKKPLPKYPTKLPTHLGPLKVRRVKDLKSDGDDCHGVFHWATRTIDINSNLQGAAAWQTLFHEYIHAGLADGGMDATLPHPVCESVCDILATLFTGLLQSGILAPEQPPKKRKP